MHESDLFKSEKFVETSHKSQLKQYLDKLRLDRKLELYVLSYWKLNQSHFFYLFQR